MSNKIIESIKAGMFDRKELENLHSNAERLGRTEILEAAKDALKEIDSRSYSKVIRAFRNHRILGDTHGYRENKPF